MKCKKCEIEIPSQFEYVLSKNVCPKCGDKLMADAAMKVYIDLKTRLHEVEFTMNEDTVCERVAMFLITNYEVVPFKLGKSYASSPTTATETAEENAAAIAKFKAAMAEIANDEVDLSPEEIRAEEAARAEDLAAAREMGMDLDDNELEDGEEMVTGGVTADRLQRLKKLAASNQIAKTGQVGMIKRNSGS